MKLRTTLGAGVATAVTAATLCALGAPALATPPAAPWDQPLTGSPIDVALTADGGSAVVLVDGGTDASGNGRPDIVQWRDADSGSVSRSVTLPSAYATGIAVATDGTVAVAGEDGASADTAVVWTIAPGESTATATDLSTGGSYAAAVAVTGDVATVGGVDNGASVLWSLPLDDLADVTSTTLQAADDTSSQSLTSVVDADGATYATVTTTSYDDGSSSSQLWRVGGGTPESVWSSDGVAVNGVAVADGLVQIAVADPGNEEAASLVTLDPTAQTTTSRGLGLRYPSSIAAFDGRVLVTTQDGAALVPATGTASYTPDDTPPLVQFDTGSAQKVIIGATAAIGITPWDASSADGDPSVFQVTAPATPAPKAVVHGTSATVSWAWPDSPQDVTAPSDGGAAVETYTVQATDTTAGAVLPPVSASWGDAFDGSGISLTVPGLVAGHLYTFAATQSNGLYTSDAGSASASVPLPATAAPSKISVSGTPTVGHKLTIKNTGSWATGAHLTYAWYANATQVGSASSYTLKTADAGKKIHVKVTGTLAGHTATPRSSAYVGPVQKPVYVVKAGVTVTGTAKVGRTLTAHIGTLPKGATVKWEWAESFGQSGGLVSGPKTSHTYTIAARAKGGRLMAIAIVTVPNDRAGEARSKLTATVTK